MTGTLEVGEGHTGSVARGRRPSTTRQDVARAGLDLFARQGFDETTVDQIAAAVGVSRRTFFRYFDSKRDVVWGEFGVELGRLRTLLAEGPADRPLMDVLRWAVVTTNRFGDGEIDELRTRIRLIGTVPSLIAHSAVMHDRWRTVVASFVAGRVGGSAEDLYPQTVAHATLGASVAAFNHWAAGSSEELTVEVDRALRLLAAGLGEGSSGLV
jgi:TetR/AcrR family transcriptional regulator, regulator of mycofactocin system